MSFLIEIIAIYIQLVFQDVYYLIWASLVAQLVKNPPAMWETEDIMENDNNF